MVMNVSHQIFGSFTEKSYRATPVGASLLPPGHCGEGLLRPAVHGPAQRLPLARRVQTSQKTEQDRSPLHVPDADQVLLVRAQQPA